MWLQLFGLGLAAICIFHISFIFYFLYFCFLQFSFCRFAGLW